MAKKETYRYVSYFGTTYRLILKKEQYHNRRTALVLYDADTGEEYTIATVNMPSVDLGDNEIIIKDYSENEGILKFLQENNIVGRPKRIIQSGFVECPVVDLLI